MALKLSLLLALLGSSLVSAQNFATLIRNCQSKHTERLNECIVGAVKVMQPRMAQGIPELNLPRMEPVFMRGFNLSQTGGPVQFFADFRNLTVGGMSKFDLKYLDVALEENKVYIGATVPGITVRGQYQIDGRVFDLPVKGAGPFIALLQGIVAEGVGQTARRNNRLRMQQVAFNFKLTDFRSKVDNLYDGVGGNTKVLRDTLDHFLRENTDMVLKEVMPLLQGNLNNFLNGVINVILAEMPSDATRIPPNANSKDKHRKRTLAIKAQRRNQSPSSQ